MCKALIIGAGGVGTVVTQKIAANPVFTDVMLASRTKSKCDAVAAAIGGGRVKTAQVDADNVAELCELFRAFSPDIVVNVALPYQDLTIMDACLECGCNYLDTANYEPKDEAHFEYSWQWAYQDRFKAAGLTAILGCGFDPGVTAIFTAYAAKHHFDEIHYLDIVDCNAGNHGMAFATNFNPEINIREVTQKGRYFENGEWVTTEPHEIHRPLNYPGYRRARIVRDLPRGARVAGQELSDHQARTFLDDLRSGVPHAPARDSEYRHGAYRPDHLQRRRDRPDPVPQGGAARSQVARRQLPRPDLDRLPYPRHQGRQGAHLLYL